MSQSSYDQHLSDHTIHPINDLLEIEGVNGQPVPYASYLQLNVQFPREFNVSEPEIQTLALIVADVHSNSDILVLIGINSLDPLYEEFCDDTSPQVNPYCGYHQVLKTLQFSHKQNSDGRLGIITQRT